MKHGDSLKFRMVTASICGEEPEHAAEGSGMVGGRIGRRDSSFRCVRLRESMF